MTDWNGILNCTIDTPWCLQPINGTNVDISIGTEDCLYLNVYTKNINPNVKSPVLIYIHASGFSVLSSSRILYAPDFLITENIVIVTANYRLGAMGHLTLQQDKLISNNNMFKDQVLMLHWVQENIAFFGGDPNQVTLSGDSAGSISSHLHMVSPLSRGLFHKIIGRSGSAFMPLAHINQNNAIDLAKNLNIDTKNLSAMVEELQSVPAEEIYQGQVNLHWMDFHLDRAMGLGLVIEPKGPDAFMSVSPDKLYKKGDFARVPMLLSNTNREGFLFKANVVPNLSELNNISVHIPKIFGRNSAKVQDKVEKFYFNDSNNEFLYPMVEFTSDVWFNYPMYQTALKHCDYQPVFMHYFQLDTKLNNFKHYQPNLTNLKGASHTDDDSYLFLNIPLTPKLDNGSIEVLWMRRMVKMQANFVKYSNPTPFPEWLLNGEILPVFDRCQRYVFNLQNDNITVESFYSKNFDLWDWLYDTYA